MKPTMLQTLYTQRANDLLCITTQKMPEARETSESSLRHRIKLELSRTWSDKRSLMQPRQMLTNCKDRSNILM